MLQPNELKPEHIYVDERNVCCKASNVRIVDDKLVADIEILSSVTGKTLLDVFAEGIPEYEEVKHPIVSFRMRAIVTCAQPPIVDTCTIIAIDAVY